ncbi:hypothetical protein W02_19530 [Nitrospira sp. KM1]|uniref:MotE family protein n=1 Tax=Nitrospira sp. KM1 TaxID=1936990 RepID=UPI0013A7840B|nr:hypothetical protein [Nitrospira sp. KM1]BCA54813.1 hypothetical protein W02_19530 [Nitrospira sp. KM1]
MRTADRHLNRQAAAPRPALFASIRPIVVGSLVSMAVLSSWGIEYLVQASSNTGPSVPSSLTPPALPSAPAQARRAKPAEVDPLAPPPERVRATDASGTVMSKGDESSQAPGAALDAPREVLAMLDLRKQDLDKREESVKQAEERLLMLKSELERILTKIEAADKRKKDVKDKVEKTVADQQVKKEQQAAETRNQHQAQLAKMFETMGAEDAAARLEKMPDRKAIELLRLLKGKTAGSILAAVRPERAARLTEKLLTTP